MISKLKQILQDSFYQLLFIYVILIVIVSLGVFSKFTLHFEIFAVIIALLGFFVIRKSPDKFINKKLHIALFIIALLLIVLFRAIPYIGNNIPLGYDTGLYKYAVESGLQNLDHWVRAGVEPGFLYLMEPLTWLFSTQFILTWLFIAFNIILGLAIYLFASSYFGKRVAVISLLIYSVSVVQFLVFTFMYYKNIIGLSLMLFSLYFLKKNESNSNVKLGFWNRNRILFIVFAGFLGAVHRPTFYIFGLSYFVYAFINPLKDKKYNFAVLKSHIINGIIILLIAGLFYIGRFSPAITGIYGPVLEGFISPGESPGTFISFFNYQFSTLAYLPFALLGFFYLLKKRQYNILFLWTIINSSIVYFQFFFFNRFIIHLDIALIILAGIGFSIIIDNKKKFGVFVLILMLFSSGFITLNEAKNAKPLISEQGLELIKNLDDLTEEDAFIMSVSKEYSPWVLAYSGRKIIAPGLFDENQWNKEEWKLFWSTTDKNVTINLMSVYNLEKPIYLFAGTKTFKNPCFELFLEKGKNEVYKYIC